jgi:hypothetical protein
MDDFNVGDRVKVEAFEGELTEHSAHRGCAEICDNSGYVHFVFLHGSSVKATKVEPPRAEHQIVRDADGDVFIWEPGKDAERPWRVVHNFSHCLAVGDRQRDEVLTYPLTVLG